MINVPAAAEENSNTAAVGVNEVQHYIFADESNLNSKYLLIGGIWVDDLTYKVVVEKCNQFKQSIGWTPDAKFNWKNVSKLTLPHYKCFIDIFFEFNLKFNTIVINQKEVCLKKNCENDPELGFYKFYYLLLWHNSSKNENVEYRIYLDRRNNRENTRLGILKEILEYGKPKFLEPGMNIKTLEPVNSKYYNLIQFSDVLLGAIGFHYNQRHMIDDASQIKCELAQYIATKINRKSLNFETSKNGHKNINIWLFKPIKIKSAL